MYQRLTDPLTLRLPMTRIRMLGARLIYVVLRALAGKNAFIIRRGGIFYHVDITEGIDLSLCALGGFQRYITGKRHLRLPQDGVILDVGANIGSTALKFAQQVPKGMVYAFEPTDYAMAKLRRNIALNPDLDPNITPVQCFVSDTSTRAHGLNAYASWKIDGSGADPHPLHGGMPMPAESTPAVTLDDFCQQRPLDRVDVIKIDTDGHERAVLGGAIQTIERWRPYVIFEIGLYTLAEQQVDFEEFYKYFTTYGYHLINCKNGVHIDLANYHKQIPLRATTDIIAIPDTQ